MNCPEITHPIIGLQTISMPVEASSFAFTSSPVISGVVGDTASVSVTNNDVDLPENYIEEELKNEKVSELIGKIVSLCCPISYVLIIIVF